MRPIRTSLLVAALVAPAFAQDPWTRIVPSNPAASARFGRKLALGGDLLAVAAPFTEGPLFESSSPAPGRVYVFHDPGSGWIEEAVLSAGALAADGDAYGFAVELAGNFLYVGAPGVSDGGSRTGKVYCYERSGGSWQLVQELSGSDTEAGDHFGASIAVDGERMLVGAPLEGFGHAEDWGKVYVFERTLGVWSEVQAFTTPDVERHDWVGYALDLEGERALIGSYTDDVGAMDGGSAWIYERRANGWQPVHMLAPSLPGAFEHFSVSVKLAGDRAYIGAHRAGSGVGQPRGAVYVFERQPGQWVETARISPDFLPVPSILGLEVDAGPNGELWSVAPFAYNGIALRWTPQAGLEAFSPPDLPPLVPAFGSALDVEPHLVAVGAQLERDAGLFASGAVYLFDPASAGRRRTTCAGAGTLWTTGSLALAHQDLALRAGDLTPGALAIAVAGPPLANLPVLAGGLCVGAPRTKWSSAVVAANGAAKFPVSFAPRADQLTAGSSWGFQVWSSASGFGPALELRFEP